MNHQFANSLYSLRGWNTSELHPDLKQIADEGFIESDDCFLLAAAAKARTNATFSALQDKTGYECFINHIHVDDFVRHGLGRQSIAFVFRVLAKWNRSKLQGKLNSIVSLHGENATVRFHYCRHGESWLADDLEDYDQAVLELPSSDMVFLKLLEF